MEFLEVKGVGQVNLKNTDDLLDATKNISMTNSACNFVQMTKSIKMFLHLDGFLLSANITVFLSAHIYLRSFALLYLGVCLTAIMA